jgi:hypothetical protein
VTGRQLAQIALGIFGVWALLDAVNVFSALGDAFAVSGGQPLGAAVVVIVLPLLLLLGLSYVLVFHNAQLAKAIAPSVDDAIGAGSPDFARLLVALLGAMIILQTLPSAVNLLLNAVVAAADPNSQEKGPLLRRIVGIAVELGCALYLVMRPERFLAFLNRPRAEHVTEHPEVTA